MALRRALVLGGAGLVGAAVMGALAARGVAVHALGHGTGSGAFELARAEEAGEAVRSARADLVVLAAAYANVDGCEADPEGSARVNVDGTLVLARLALANGARFAWFSSDYVFDGRNGPYDEYAAPAPMSVYGRQKAVVEAALERLDPRRTLVVRTTGVFGPELRRKNFVLRLVDRARAGEPTRVPADQTSTPTYAPDLGEFVAELAVRGASGLYHAAGADLAPRDVLARTALEVFGLDPGLVESCTTESLGQTAPRPLRGGLLTGRIARFADRQPLGLRAGLEQLRIVEEGPGR